MSQYLSFGSSPLLPTSSRDSQRDIEAGIDYFKLLGVREEAEAAEVVSAFRARVRAVHPDANAGAGDPGRVALLVRARSTLAGPEREAYTNALRAHRSKQAARGAPPKPRAKRPFDWDETCRKVKAQAKIDLALHEERERELERQARARAEAEAEQAWADATFERDGLAPDWYDLEVTGDDYVRRARARTEELLRHSRAHVEAEMARTRANVEASHRRTRDDIESQRRQIQAEMARSRTEVEASHRRTRDDIERRSRQMQTEMARSRAEVAAAQQRTRDDIERQMRQTQEAIDRTLRRYR